MQKCRIGHSAGAETPSSSLDADAKPGIVGRGRFPKREHGAVGATENESY